MQPNKQGSKLLRIAEIFYSFLLVVSYLLLINSRTGQAQTVWQVLHPAFIPTVFVTTLLLIWILFSSERTTYKLLFIIAHSILIHSLFSIIFPAGDLSGQQTVLGRTRRIFDNTILHGFSGWPEYPLQVTVIEAFLGINFQAALSTVLARLFSVDIFYVHLSLVPILWSTFIPIAIFLLTRTAGGSEKVSVLSSLLVSAFPYTIYWGAISVPNSLGFIFFLYSLYFMLKSLSSDDSKTGYWILPFSFFSFLSHYLTGIMSFSLILLTVAFRTYRGRKGPSAATARASLMISFILCASLLPISFIYLKLFGPSNVALTLDKIDGVPLTEIVGLALIGDYVYVSDLRTILPIIAASILPFICMAYLLFSNRGKSDSGFRIHTYFLSAALLIMSVDYMFLKLFMSNLPINEDRLWVFRDLITASLVTLALHQVASALQPFLKARSNPVMFITHTWKFPKVRILSFSCLLLVLNFLISLVLGGWITLSLNAAYPQVAPLQTTWYELEAVKYIKEKTDGKYVVICDFWTIFAGEMVEGVYNEEAYYFGEYDRRGYDLFSTMCTEPSANIMINAMNQTGANTTIAYFIVCEPRLGTEKFNNVVLKTQAVLTVFQVFGAGRLYIFSYRKV